MSIKKKGLIAGNFDVIYPGYVRYFKETSQYELNLFDD